MKITRKGHSFNTTTTTSSLKEESRIYLQNSSISWVDTMMLPSELVSEFEQFWKLHPIERGKIRIYGKEITTPRWQQSYGLPYWFAGMEHKALSVPSIVQPILDYANNSNYGPFNQVLLNWYDGPTDYIGAHSDDIRNARKTPSGGTTVFSVTLQEPGSTHRTFRIKPRNKKYAKDRLDITMPHGSVIVMCGHMQETHTHQVPKSKSNRGRRINITLRNHKM